MELLRREGLSLEGKHAVVIGNSNAVGMPLSSLLRDAGAASVRVRSTPGTCFILATHHDIPGAS
jgi:methylenetetrahydrofolate dehydrogenase (NADP+)/methenyltetrahydrofolate cyclohydrolase